MLVSELKAVTLTPVEAVLVGTGPSRMTPSLKCHSRRIDEP